MLDRQTAGDIRMPENMLAEIRLILDQIFELYKNQEEFLSQCDSAAKKNMAELKKTRDNKNNDPNIRWLASIAAITESRTMAVQSAYVATLNTFARISTIMYQSINAINSELPQITTPILDTNMERISELEKQLTKLNKEFRRYSPTLRKFKQALDQTEKTLRDNQ